MIEILTVCTGNICRSPLAAVWLRDRLDRARVDAKVHSAGTQGLNAVAMTSDAQRLATDAGIQSELASAHRSRPLFEQLLVSPDLVLAMTREHRARILSLVPAAMHRTFTAREFARISATLSDDDIRDAASAGTTASARLRAAVRRLSMARSSAPASTASDDDVIDPYRREWSVYEQSAAQLYPALAEVERVVRLSR